jgi:hypothetical protein
MSQVKQTPFSRRKVFAAGGTVSALAAVASVMPLVREAGPAPSLAATATDKPDGYQVTQHVLRYYQTARV